MNRTAHSIPIIIAIVMMSLLTSCLEPLCYDHFPTADIAFDWEREWERDYGMSHADVWDADAYGLSYHELRPDKPEWVHLLLYNPDGSSDQKFLNPEGGKIIIDKSKGSSMLFYNGDTEYIILSDLASLPEARASATSRSRSSASQVMKRHPDSRSTNPPDILWAAYLEETPDIAMHEVRGLPVKMQPLVYTYLIRYEFEAGLQYVALARGALGGMAESVYLRDGKTSDETSIILYDCDLKFYGCEARVRSFGVPGFPDEYYGRSDLDGDETERPYSLNLEVVLKNGKYLVFDFDITEQMRKQPRGGIITVSGIRIEDELGNAEGGSGFDVDLIGWGSHEDIELDIK